MHLFWCLNLVRAHVISPVPVPKHIVATQLLERAIELYLRGDSYYAALNIGGAAEEVLAVYLRDMQTELPASTKPASDQMKAAFLAFSASTSSEEQASLEKWIHDRIFAAKNSVKHKRGKNDWSVIFDAKAEAYDMIDMAISNYFQLFSHTNLPHLPCIQEFDIARRAERLSDEA